MASILLTPPALEPLTLVEAKAWLRVEHDDDDALITTLITGARTHIETATRRALIAQTWRIIRDAWPANGRLDVFPSPLRQVSAARVYDAFGQAQAIDPQVFAIDNAAVPSIVAVTSGAMQKPGRALAGIEIDVVAGYGTTAEAVPEPLKQAIRALLAHWYEHRGIAAAGENAQALPQTVAALIAPYRVFAL